MHIVVERVDVLVQRILDEARKAVDVPAIRDFLDRIPGGQAIRTMIGHTTQTPVKFEPLPVVYPPIRVPVAPPVPATVAMPVQAEPLPVEKTIRRAGKPPAAKPPVPTGTRVRILTGAFTDWTGPLHWSPAKGVYNVPLTGPAGQRTRTTLSPSRRGTSWEVMTETAPIRKGTKRKRHEAQS